MKKSTKLLAGVDLILGLSLLSGCTQPVAVVYAPPPIDNLATEATETACPSFTPAARPGEEESNELVYGPTPMENSAAGVTEAVSPFPAPAVGPEEESVAAVYGPPPWREGEETLDRGN